MTVKRAHTMSLSTFLAMFDLPETLDELLGGDWLAIL
jgi:hypothetical protein